jgi:hypothetical protein
MPESDRPPGKPEQQQRRRVLALQRAVYMAADPSGQPDRLRQLAQEEARLHDLERLAAQAPPLEAKEPAESAPRGRLLGPETTGLKVETTLHLQPVPTGIYHLLDPEADPLVTVVVANVSLVNRPRRVCVKAHVEGLSAEAVRTVEVRRGRSSPPLHLLPTLFPERARAIAEIQRATLHVRIEDLDGKPECHDTFPLVLLARTSSFNAARDPQTGRPLDLTHYYGAWVTPYAEPVQQRVRRAADLCPAGMLWGYQRDSASVTAQVGALFQSLKEAGLAYVCSVIDYGCAAGQATQRTRLPRESLALKSANRIDGAVVFASLLEGASLSAALLLVPGHALAGWEAAEGSGDWRFLETTMLGSHDFEAACASGQRQYEQAREYHPDRLRLHPLADLRARGIWPME